MYWRCKCGHKNPENARACGKCKSTEDAKKKFYWGALISASFVFCLVYVAGVSVGGTLLVFAVEPTSDEILAEAKALGMKTESNGELKNIYDLKPEQKQKAEAATLEKARASMSGLVRNTIYWIATFLLFPVCSLIFGYTTAGRTIIEVAIGSIVGQGIGFAALKFGNGVPLSYLELGIGIVVAFLIVALGEYIGETIQEKKEREVLDETRDSELATSAWSA